MTGITLDTDEFVLSELNNAQDGSSMITRIYNVTLTNKRIIASKAGAFGKSKVAFEKPISEIKVYNGSAQVKVATIGGFLTQIDIFLTSGKLSFKVNGAGNADAIQFANEINHIITESEVDIYSVDGNDTGTKAIKNVLFGTTSTEAKKTANQKVAIKCTGCGATFEGIKGKTAKCPYCGSYYNT